MLLLLVVKSAVSHCDIQRLVYGWCPQVMGVVKGLVKTGMTICATIHSPTPHCFRLFDAMMILLRGRVVYAGQNGARSLLSCLPHAPYRAT